MENDDLDIELPILEKKEEKSCRLPDDNLQISFFNSEMEGFTPNGRYCRFTTPLASIEAYFGCEHKEATITLLKITFDIGGIETFTCPDDVPLFSCKYVADHEGKGFTYDGPRSICLAFHGEWERDFFQTLINQAFSTIRSK